MTDDLTKTFKEWDFRDVRLQDHLQGNLEILPLRTLDDFILASAKFQIPDYKHAGRWGHRVYNNLYYYQTNYFLTAVLIFMYFLFMYNSKLLYGMMLTHNLIKLLPWLRSRGKINIQDMIAIAMAIVVLRYFEFSIQYAVSSLILFWTSIFTILFVTFVHASLRLRNLSNRFVNFFEKRDPRTPMTVLMCTCVSYLINNVVMPSVKKMPKEDRDAILTIFSKNKLI